MQEDPQIQRDINTLVSGYVTSVREQIPTGTDRSDFRRMFYRNIAALRQVFPEVSFIRILRAIGNHIVREDSRYHVPLSIFFQDLLVHHHNQTEIGGFDFMNWVVRRGGIGSSYYYYTTPVSLMY